MADPLQNLPPQVTAALERGNLIHAIKLLREQRPQMGLAEAKALLEALQKQGNAKVIVKTNVSTSVQHAAKPHAAPVPHAPGPQGHRQHADPPPSMDPHVSPGEVPRTSNSAAFFGVVVAIAAVIAAAAFFSR